jgi:hypothetical protein
MIDDDSWFHYLDLIHPNFAPPCISFRNVANELRAACERGSGRVVIALGHRAVGCGEEILQLAERVGAPVLTRLDATPDVWRGWLLWEVDRWENSYGLMMINVSMANICANYLWDTGIYVGKANDKPAICW